jgi:hypothetical protein
LPEDTTPLDHAEPSEKSRPVNLREAKKLITLRLRDPSTDAKSFTRLMSIMNKLAGWKRKPRRVKNESDDVNELVLQLERQQRVRQRVRQAKG